ncbi:MAG TPA: hopanoid-associated sugar epimerase [Kofleriaceae bacterium]|nr:hopanoid-associated sugar epimerase [Kofleriaceae bacterium]
MSTGTTLVTGATGFIGSAVVRRLLGRGRAVRCYVEPGASRQNLAGLDVEIIEADINDRQAIGRALEGAEALYHLAAIYKLWLPDNALMYEVNVEGTKTVLFAALRAGVGKVVYTSSIAAVGRPEQGELADETTPFNLWDESNHYVRSKWLSERDALRFAREGLPLVVVNPAFPFGARDIAPTPTGRFVVDALAGRVPGYTDGGFNAVNVEDVAEAHILAEERGRVGERYILGDHNVSYKQFFDAVAEVAGLKPITRKLPTSVFLGVAWMMEKAAEVRGKAPMLTYKSARYASRNLWFDTRKAHEELGMPTTPLAESIEQSVRWFRDHGQA